MKSLSGRPQRRGQVWSHKTVGVYLVIEERRDFLGGHLIIAMNDRGGLEEMDGTEQPAHESEIEQG